MARRAGLLRSRLNERTLLSWAQTNESLRTADSSSRVIAVMQPAHAPLANHCTVFQRACPASRRLLVQPEVRSVVVIIGNVLGEESAGARRAGMLFPPHRVLRRRAGPGAGVSGQPLDAGGGDRGGGVQTALADRAVFQGLKAKSSGEDLHRNFRQCPADASLGGVDRHVADQVPATEGDVWLVAFQSGGPTAAAVVRLPRLVGLDRSSLSSPGVARSAAP